MRRTSISAAIAARTLVARRRASASRSRGPRERLRGGLWVAALLLLALPLATAAAGERRLTGGGLVYGLASPPEREETSGTFIGIVRDAARGDGRFDAKYVTQGTTLIATYSRTHGRSTLRGAFVLTSAPAGDGTLQLTGNHSITGGTGMFRRARGRGSLTGMQNANGLITLSFSEHMVAWPR